MRRYRNVLKGVIIEAVQLTPDNVGEVSAWANNARIIEMHHPDNPDDIALGLNVDTPMGVQRLLPGMVLVKYRDQFYLTQEGTFHRYYRPLTPEPEEEAFVKPEELPPDPFGRTRLGSKPFPKKGRKW